MSSGAIDEFLTASESAKPGRRSESWWWGKVRDGVAPSPDIQLPKMTRWRASKVKTFWEGLVEQSKAQAVAPQPPAATVPLSAGPIDAVPLPTVRPRGRPRKNAVAACAARASTQNGAA